MVTGRHYVDMHTGQNSRFGTKVPYKDLVRIFHSPPETGIQSLHRGLLHHAAIAELIWLWNGHRLYPGLLHRLLFIPEKSMVTAAFVKIRNAGGGVSGVRCYLYPYFSDPCKVQCTPEHTGIANGTRAARGIPRLPRKES